MNNLSHANSYIEKLIRVIENEASNDFQELYTGVDLGTAAVVLTVVNEKGIPVAGAYQFANVVKDGMVVNYLEAIKIVKNLKETIETKLNNEILYASVAIPPGTERLDGGAVKNVAEAAGFEVIDILDEPTAANSLLKIEDGAIIDIGGGTIGISIVKDSKVINSIDEATGGRHFSLVLAGAMNISYEVAELIKRDFSKHDEIFPIVKPVIDKIITIIENAIGGYDISQLILVGGTANLKGIDKYIESKIRIETISPIEPMFVTPLGLAIDLIEKGEIYGY